MFDRCGVVCWCANRRCDVSEVLVVVVREYQRVGWRALMHRCRRPDGHALTGASSFEEIESVKEQ